MERRPAKEEGFTLIELTAVVAIVGILAALAIVSYRHFTWKAKNVEAEVALVEVHRLQQMHLANTGSYSVDFGAIGFSPAPPLKYYSVNLQLMEGAGGIDYQVSATPKLPGDGGAFVLTRHQDGHVVIDKPSAVSGSSSSGQGDPSAGLTGSGSAGTSGGSGAGGGSFSEASGASSSGSGSSGSTAVPHGQQLGVASH